MMIVGFWIALSFVLIIFLIVLILFNVEHHNSHPFKGDEFLRRANRGQAFPGRVAYDPDDYQVWLKRGIIHREDGPAIMSIKGHPHLWYWKGQRVTLKTWSNCRANGIRKDAEKYHAVMLLKYGNK